MLLLKRGGPNLDTPLPGWEIPQSAGLAATPGRSRGGAPCAGGGGGPFGPNHPPRRVVENGRVCFVQVTERLRPRAPEPAQFEGLSSLK
jgi:hypothetical protein